MITTQLLMLHAFTIALFTWCAHAAFGVSWGVAVLCGLLSLLALMAIGLAVTWVFAWRYWSTTPRISAMQVVRMVWGEYLSLVLLAGVLMPFGRWVMRPDRVAAHPQPLLLVHGYSCDRACWWWMRRRLEAAGHPVGTITLEPPWGGIDDMVPQLQRRIDDVLAASGARQLTLVAHSMGGLVSRAYLKQHGPEKVAGLITIATPHHGTEIARLGIGQDARQMEPNSPWLQALGEAPLGVPFVSIRTPHDNIVMPQDTQRMTGALDAPVPALGHIAALFSPRVLALVLQHAGAMRSGAVNQK